MITKPMCATSTPRRAQLALSANVHSVPPNSRLRTCQPRSAKNAAMRARTVSASPATCTLACSGIASIFTGFRRGMRRGITLVNVAAAIEHRIRPSTPMYAGLW